MPLNVPWGDQPVPAGVLICQGWAIFCGVLICISIFQTFSFVLSNQPDNVFRAVKDLFPVVVLNVLLHLWEPSLQFRYTRIIYLFTGLLFFYYTSQMILFS